MRALILAGAAVTMLAGGAQAQSWSSWTERPPAKVGLAYGNHYGSLWFLCEGGGKALAYITANGGSYAEGSKAAVTIAVDAQRFDFSGPVEISEMDDTAYIEVMVDVTADAALFAALGDGARAVILWPQGEEVIPLRGSGVAIGAFMAAC